MGFFKDLHDYINNKITKLPRIIASIVTYSKHEVYLFPNYKHNLKYGDRIMVKDDSDLRYSCVEILDISGGYLNTRPCKKRWFE